MIKSMVSAAVVGLGLMCAPSALALEAAPTSNFAKEQGKSLPPIGFVRFCVSFPRECRGASLLTPSRVKLTSDRWNQIFRVNRNVNGRIKPMTDQDLYGKVEHWTYPTTAGDCEDYLLLKKRELEALGFASGTLLITVVLDERNEGHAVLTIATDAGDYVLDNRRDDILLWNETGYKFLKRQSGRDPKAWVSLDVKTPVAASSLGTASGE